MSAKELTFFLSKNIHRDRLLNDLVDKLELSVIPLPSDLGLEYEFLARRGEKNSILELEFSQNASSIIQELANWDNPSDDYKNELSSLHSSINLFYRDINNAREFIYLLNQKLSDLSEPCIVENSEGCLLRLSQIVECLKDDKNWSWERREFPELNDVAISEWSEEE